MANGNTEPTIRSPSGANRAELAMVVVVVVLRVAVGGAVGEEVDTSVGWGVCSSVEASPSFAPPSFSPPSLSPTVGVGKVNPSVSEEEDDDTGVTPGNPRNNDIITGCNDTTERVLLDKVLVKAPSCPSVLPTIAEGKEAVKERGEPGEPETSSRSCRMLLIRTARTARRQCSVTVKGRGRRMVSMHSLIMVKCGEGVVVVMVVWSSGFVQ